MNIWGKILYKGSSPFNGEVKVVEFLGGQRRLFASAFAQSRSLKQDGSSEFYWDAFADNVDNLPEKAEIVILGLGAGTSASSLRKKFPQAKIDGVEIDPLMIELGRKYFDLDEAHVNIYTEDAAVFVKKNEKKYDLVGLDLFVGSTTPGFVFQDEFFGQLKNLMKEDSLLIANKIYERAEEVIPFKEFFERHFKILGEVRTQGRREPGNLILYGGKK